MIDLCVEDTGKGIDRRYGNVTRTEVAVRMSSKAYMYMVVGLILLTMGCTRELSPTGTLVFESYRDGNAEVYIVNVDGSNLKNLTNSPAYDGTPHASPDGMRVAFTSERSGNPEVHIMDADGSNVEQLTDGRGFNVVPAWSPDGSQILFVSNRTYEVPYQEGYFEVNANTKLWVINADGSNPTRRTTRLGLDMYGSWSPDGQSIVFMSVRDGNPEIYMLEPDHTEVNLTNDPARDLNPSWSPDGSSVAFMSDREGNMEIYILDLDDGSLSNVTQHPDNDGDPEWSPDGSQIAFISDRDGHKNIYVMNADGTNVRQVTDHPADDIHPQWVPQ